MSMQEKLAQAGQFIDRSRVLLQGSGNERPFTDSLPGMGTVTKLRPLALVVALAVVAGGIAASARRVDAAGCRAEEIATYPPNIDGSGHKIEATASGAPGNEEWVQVDYYYPQGDKTERRTVLTPGMSVDFIDAGGAQWKYRKADGCDLDYVLRQVNEGFERRRNAGENVGDEACRPIDKVVDGINARWRRGLQ